MQARSVLVMIVNSCYVSVLKILVNNKLDLMCQLVYWYNIKALDFHAECYYTNINLCQVRLT